MVAIPTIYDLMCTQNLGSNLYLVMNSKPSMVVLGLKDVVSTSSTSKIIDLDPIDVLGPNDHPTVEDVVDLN